MQQGGILGGNLVTGKVTYASPTKRRGIDMEECPGKARVIEQIKLYGGSHNE